MLLEEKDSLKKLLSWQHWNCQAKLSSSNTDQQERNGSTRLLYLSHSPVAVFGMFFVGEIEQKRPILCLKRKSLDINFFFIIIELLYKM